MKNCFFGILISLVILLPGRAGAQDVNLSAGIGLPELINLGLRIQFDQSEFGISVGTFPEPDEDILTLTGNFYYHFGGSSEFTGLRPWFVKTGLTYAFSENEWERTTYLFLDPRVGREFNISPKFAVALEAGFIVILFEDEFEKKQRPDSFWNLEFDFSGAILPSAGINLIYRF